MKSGDFVVDFGIALGGVCPDDRPLVFKYPIYATSYKSVIDALKEQGLDFMLKAKYARPDPLFFYTNEGSLSHIAPDLVFPADEYIEGKKDCDDYTRAARDRLSWKYKLSSFDAWGNIEIEYHSFPLTMTGIGNNKIGRFWIIEVNAGFPWAGVPFRIGENGYQAEAFKH